MGRNRPWTKLHKKRVNLILNSFKIYRGGICIIKHVHTMSIYTFLPVGLFGHSIKNSVEHTVFKYRDFV